MERTKGPTLLMQDAAFASGAYSRRMTAYMGSTSTMFRRNMDVTLLVQYGVGQKRPID